MPAVNVMDADALAAWVMRRLGAPQLKVELTREDIEDAIEEAKRWFAAKKGLQKTTTIQVQANTTDYTLPVDVDVVLDVAFPGRQTDFSRLIDPLALLDQYIPYHLFPQAKTGGLFSTYYQSLQYLDMAKRIIGAEADWSQQGTTLQLFPEPTETGTLILFYKTNDFKITELSERDHDLVKRYTLAFAKLKLGRVRSKRVTVPEAQGQITLDGERLLNEANEEIEKLTEELALSGYPMGFLMG